MSIIGMRKASYIVSMLLVSASIVALIVWGLKFGIDFTGGSLLEVEYTATRSTHDEVKKTLGMIDIENVLIQPTGDRGLILRLQDVNEEKHQQILQTLGVPIIALEKRFDS